MSERARQRAGSACLCLGLAVTMFILILTALHAVGTDDGLYYREQMRADVLPLAGISDGDLRALDEAMAAWLAGDRTKLAPDGERALPMAVLGETRPAFNDREMAHMRDCFDLFALLRKVRARLVPWAVLLTVLGARLVANRRRIRRIAWLSPLILLVPLGAFAAWAALDFGAAFTFFHRLLFRNDLWLLDPRTDLLIRICPAGMFMHMGARIGLMALAALLGVPLVVALLTIIRPRGRREAVNTWNNPAMRRASAQKRITFGKTDMR